MEFLGTAIKSTAEMKHDLSAYIFNPYFNRVYSTAREGIKMHTFRQGRF